MSWLHMLLGLVVVMLLSRAAHPASVLAFLIEVRSGPGVVYEGVATMAPVGSVVAVAQEQEWYMIQLPDGRQGWVHQAALQPEPPTRTPPVEAPTAPAAVALAPSAPTPAVTPPSPRKTVTAPPPARATALVIGNAAYPVGPLQNTGHDATDMAAT